MSPTIKLFVFTAILVCGYSCHQRNPNCYASVEVSFTNKSNLKTKLTISNDTDSVQLVAAGNSSDTKTLCFKNRLKIDGGYLLHLKNLAKDTIISRGYYTNGYPMESSINIVFEKDTISFKTNSY